MAKLCVECNGYVTGLAFRGPNGGSFIPIGTFCPKCRIAKITAKGIIIREEISIQ